MRPVAGQRDQQAPSAEPSQGVVLPTVTFMMLVVSLLAWRASVYYSGGVDPVVIGKALLAGAALTLAWLGAPAGVLDRLRPRTVALAVCYVAVCMVGATGSGNMLPSGVLSVRLLMVLATVALLVTSLPAPLLVRSYATAMGVVGLVLAAAGAPTLVTGGGPALTAGRLTGGLLGTSPNEMALLFGPPALVLIWRLTQARARVWHVGLLLGLVGLTWLTASRAGLLGLALGALLLALLAPRIKLGTLTTMLISVPALFFLATFTGLFSGYFGRGGTQNLTTLNSRTLAWQAAFDAGHDFFTRWFGGGLSIKTVSVVGTYWDSQVLDSSWVSGFVQAGALGLVILAMWSVTTLWRAARHDTPYRSLWLAMAAYAVLRSLLENGLLDVYVLFVVMLVPALMVDLRHPRDDEADDQVDAQPQEQTAGNVRDEVSP